MKRSFTQLFLLLAFNFISLISSAQQKDELLYLITDTATDACGYMTAAGDTVIPFGKYLHCYTDHFKQVAIVNTKDSGLVGINRNGQILFSVFVYDNGPDYPEEGLFRIVKNRKIGYANFSGDVIIQPMFDGAFPFKNGVAEVCDNCTISTEGEHSLWVGGTWYNIDKRGNRIKAAAHSGHQLHSGRR